LKKNIIKKIFKINNKQKFKNYNCKNNVKKIKTKNKSEDKKIKIKSKNLKTILELEFIIKIFLKKVEAFEFLLTTLLL